MDLDFLEINKVSPNLLLAIIILSIIFFISGALHLFVRMLLRPPTRSADLPENLTALEGQLQQLFHLHDAGVDQSFIDTLPVFDYKSIVGVKDPFDCAVCLCKFAGEDELRLLPKCSHAFHVECIDTWLLAHSTCPLCRASLVDDLLPNRRGSSPIVLVLESRSGSSREVGNLDSGLGRNIDSSDEVLVQECGEIVSIKLGRFESVDENCGEGSSDDNSDNSGARRCFSMGSFAYVMDENLSLQVPIRTAAALSKKFVRKHSLPLKPGHRQAMSECGCDSRREFNPFEALKIQESEDKCIDGIKKESFSVSKIWLREKVDKGSAAKVESRRAFSFRFPVAGEDVHDQENAPGFAWRTLLWIVGKPNKVVVNSQFATNV